MQFLPECLRPRAAPAILLVPMRCPTIAPPVGVAGDDFVLHGHESPRGAMHD